MWAESAPGLEDFRPFELKHGQLMQFWGAQCVSLMQPVRFAACCFAMFSFYGGGAVVVGGGYGGGVAVAGRMALSADICVVTASVMVELLLVAL